MDNNLFQNKYRVPSARLPSWDYSSAGFYFVTICTKDRKEYFGDVNKEEMVFNDLGIIARKYWQEIPRHFAQVELDEYIIMPNHVHGIIKIRRDEALPRLYKGMPYSGSHVQMSKISPKQGSLAVIIGSYKSAVAKYIHQLQDSKKFQWQSRYYDAIIWDERSLQNIYEYIKNNPINWQYDRNNPEGLYM
ncbi:transposase [Patescibacteria group bacterium]|nr:transposase [Patescibacteria group bacterium]MBU1922048.1 transposase [Patescibacteria group bacterium]